MIVRLPHITDLQLPHPAPDLFQTVRSLVFETLKDEDPLIISTRSFYEEIGREAVRRIPDCTADDRDAACRGGLAGLAETGECLAAQAAAEIFSSSVHKAHECLKATVGLVRCQHRQARQQARKAAHLLLSHYKDQMLRQMKIERSLAVCSLLLEIMTEPEGMEHRMDFDLIARIATTLKDRSGPHGAP